METHVEEPRDEVEKESHHDDEVPSAIIESKPIIKTEETQEKEWFEMDDDHNTYVYVSGLPLTMDGEEFVDLMKKYGVIKFRDQRQISVAEQEKNLPTNIYNIKMYKNKDGSFKGDALCCYARIESVDLALEYLDGYQYDDKHIIHVERAKFELKGQYDPSKKPKKANKKYKEKQKKKLENLLAWKPDKLPVEKKNNLTVVISNMFKVNDFVEDPAQILEYREDLEDRCGEIGTVKKVVIYDQNPDGVATVTFEDFSSAERCVELLNGRFYAKRQLNAKLWDGKTKYKVQETDEESAARLKKWHEDLEKDVIQRTDQTVTRDTSPDEPQIEQPRTSHDTPDESPPKFTTTPRYVIEESQPKRLKTFNSKSDDESDGDVDKIQDDDEDEDEDEEEDEEEDDGDLS